jgi:hypothetical protein
MSRALALLLFAAVVGGSSWPVRALEHDVQHWHNAFLLTRVQPSGLETKSPLVGYLEFQPRFSLWQTPGPTVALFRGALGFEASPGLTLWAGMGSIPSHGAVGWRVNEFRLWQQVLFMKRYDDVQLLLRGRLEERAFEETAGVGLRARALLRASIDIPGTDRRFAALVWDEPFVGLLGVSGKSAVGFDQNRAFAGGIFRPTPWLAFELGYLNVLLGDPSKDGARILHVVAASTVVNAL